MTLKNKILPTFFVTCLLLLLLACSQGNTNKKASQASNIVTDNQVMTIDTFSVFPPEIDGCSCYFSNDSTEFKKGIYVYMNDYTSISFLKINGTLTKFIQTEYKNVNQATTVIKAKNDNYEMTIEITDGMQSGDETWLKTGVIKLSDKKGNTITKTFYGECGC